MMPILVALLLAEQTPSAVGRWHGRLAIGSQVYVVAAEHANATDGSIRFSLTLSQGEPTPVHSVVATLGRNGGQVSIDNGPLQALTPEIAAAWREQLAAGLQRDVSSAEYECRETGQNRECDSRTLVALDDSLAGRLRLLYNKLNRLVGIRFFSLAEWTNPFREYLSLSLDVE